MLRQQRSSNPSAAVLSCADSRVPVELVFDQTIGQVFVCRIAVVTSRHLRLSPASNTVRASSEPGLSWCWDIQIAARWPLRSKPRRSRDRSARSMHVFDPPWTRRVESRGGDQGQCQDSCSAAAGGVAGDRGPSKGEKNHGHGGLLRRNDRIRNAR